MVSIIIVYEEFSMDDLLENLYFEPDDGKEGRIKEIVLDTTAESIYMASVYYRGRRPGNYKIRLMN
jgi:hypothetical protein